MPLPVMSKAEPWIGSNIEGVLRSGLRLAVGAMPSEPASAAARSDRMSACRLVATMVSSVSRLQRHAHGHGVDQHLVPGDVGKFARHLGGDLVPHHHAVALRVRLGDDGQQLARARAGQLEGEAHDAGDAGAGEHRDVGRDLLAAGPMHAAADAGIFAFRVLAHDHPVELGPGDVAQRAGDAGQDAGRADIGVLVERLADREPQAPQRDVVGHVGRADGAEVDRVELAQLVGAVRPASSRRASCSSPSPSRNASTSSAKPPSRSAQASSTSSPAAITSGPMPSPPIAAILWVRMKFPFVSVRSSTSPDNAWGKCPAPRACQEYRDFCAASAGTCPSARSRT